MHHKSKKKVMQDKILNYLFSEGTTKLIKNIPHDIFIDELDVKSFNIGDKFISNGLPDTKYQEIFAEVASVSFCLLAIYEEYLYDYN